MSIRSRCANFVFQCPLMAKSGLFHSSTFGMSRFPGESLTATEGLSEDQTLKKSPMSLCEILRDTKAPTIGLARPPKLVLVSSNEQVESGYGIMLIMAKPEWGTKRTCPECSTRFYDLGKDEPATCISCGHAWTPEPLLQSRPIGRRASKAFYRRPPWTPK